MMVVLHKQKDSDTGTDYNLGLERCEAPVRTIIFLDGKTPLTANDIFARSILESKKSKNTSGTGTRTLVWNVRGPRDNHLHYTGCYCSCMSY